VSKNRNVLRVDTDHTIVEKRKEWSVVLDAGATDIGHRWSENIITHGFRSHDLLGVLLFFICRNLFN